MQDKLDELFDKSQNGYSFGNIYKTVRSRENILLAFRNMKSNSGSKTPGIDGKTIDTYKEMNENDFVDLIQKALDNYSPETVKRVFIPKKNGKSRPLGIPTIKDRIIQQCLLQILEPICEAKFHPHSYGFRPNRSTEHAIARMSTLINVSQMHYVVDVDIKGFFDNINHKKLRRQLWNVGIEDKQILSILTKMLRAPIEKEGIPTKGTPQGSILSPLLANVVLNELDWWVSSQWETFESEHKYSRNDAKYLNLRRTSKLKEGFIIRYADDFKILCRNREAAEKWFHAVTKWLNERLNLETSPEKSKITNLRKRKSEFLGFEFKAIKKGVTEGRDKGKTKFVAKTNVSGQNIKIIKNKIREQIKLMKDVHTRKTVWDFNVYLRGVHNYFSLATNAYDDFNGIAYSVLKLMKNRLKNRGKPISCKEAGFKEKQYAKLSRKTYIVKEQPLIPINGVNFKKPNHFTQQINDYTEEGRKKNGNYQLEYQMKVAVNFLARYFIPSRSVQYNDNRISKFSASKGKCYVTGFDLLSDIKKYHCHHKIPISMGGTDDYTNLIVLHEDVHRLVHATSIQTIQKYSHMIKDNKQKARINQLRKHCGLNAI